MSELRHAQSVLPEMSSEVALVRPHVGRTLLGKRLQRALAEEGVDAGPTTLARQGKGSSRSLTREQKTSRKETVHGPEIEAFATAWGIPPELFQEWLRQSFPGVLSRPENLRAIQVVSDLEPGTFSVARRVDGATEIAAPALMTPSEAGSSDQQFNHLLRAQYRAESTLLFPEGLPPTFEASLQRAKISLSGIGEEAFAAPAAETGSLFKEQLIARLLVRLRTHSVQQREQVAQVVSQFMLALERAPHRFSLSETALERQTGVERMRHLVRIASIKNILGKASLEEELQERLLAHFERPRNEWSLHERISALSEDLQGSMQDRALIADVRQHAEEALQAGREEVYRTLRPTDTALASTLLHGTGRRMEHHALIQSEQDTHQVIACWDQVRQSLRVLRRGLRAYEVGPLEQDVFALEEYRLEEGIQAFQMEWRRLTPAQRLKLHVVLQKLDRSYEGQDAHLSAIERTHLLRLLEQLHV